MRAASSTWATTAIPTSRWFRKNWAKREGVAVEQGVSGATPGSRPAFVAMGHLYFDSVAEFQSAFGPYAGAIMADIPNYTDIQPTIQISDVKIWGTCNATPRTISYPSFPRKAGIQMQLFEHLPPVQARGRLWTPAFAGVTITCETGHM